MASSLGPWTAVWVALQELGAALDAVGDLPDWATQLNAAVEDAKGAAEEAALTEDTDE